MPAIARRGSRGPFRIDDLMVPGAYDPYAPALRGCDAELVRRARTQLLALDDGHPDRAPISYVIQRLVAGPLSPSTPMLADRLADLIRTRTP